MNQHAAEYPCTKLGHTHTTKECLLIEDCLTFRGHILPYMYRQAYPVDYCESGNHTRLIYKFFYVGWTINNALIERGALVL